MFGKALKKVLALLEANGWIGKDIESYDETLDVRHLKCSDKLFVSHNLFGQIVSSRGFPYEVSDLI